VLVALTVSLSVGVATATAAKGGNSANARLCQKGGWEDLVRKEDGTAFKNQGKCVSYAARGGMLMAKPTCTAGSDNFSDDANFSRPTTWAGGTIDGPYANVGQVIPFNGQQWMFNRDTTGIAAPFRLTFTNAVSSVQLDARANTNIAATTLTLKAYDSSNAIVDTDAATVTATIVSLSVSSATGNNIKYFTMEVDHIDGYMFSNIVWGCAA